MSQFPLAIEWPGSLKLMAAAILSDEPVNFTPMELGPVVVCLVAWSTHVSVLVCQVARPCARLVRKAGCGAKEAEASALVNGERTQPLPTGLSEIDRPVDMNCFAQALALAGPPRAVTFTGRVSWTRSVALPALERYPLPTPPFPPLPFPTPPHPPECGVGGCPKQVWIPPP